MWDELRTVYVSENDLNWFITHKKRVEVALLALILLVNATANSFVVLMETSSSAMQSWEPWVWEFSSMLALAALPLPLAWWTDRLPLQFRQPGRQLQHHLIGVMVFTGGSYFADGWNPTGDLPSVRWSLSV